MERIGFSCRSDSRGCPGSTFRQDVAEPLTLGDTRDYPQHCLAITEPERLTDAGFVDDAPFNTLHRHRQCEAERGRIKPEFVAENIGLEDIVQSPHAEVGAEGTGYLLMNAACSD